MDPCERAGIGLPQVIVGTTVASPVGAEVYLGEAVLSNSDSREGTLTACGMIRQPLTAGTIPETCNRNGGKDLKELTAHVTAANLVG